MNRKIRILSALLCLLIVVGSMTLTASAISFTKDATIGTGTVLTADNKNVTADGKVTYAKATYTDSESRSQAVYALEFNPKTSDYMPYVYCKYTGTGSGTYASAVEAEKDDRYNADVVGGVNATFFAMATGSTYAGYWVHDGRLAQATVGLQNDIVTFNSNGEIKVVNSKLDFKLFLNGKVVSYNGGSGIAHINKYSEAANVDNRFYYWDAECGSKTDSVIDGTEILCKKLDLGELSIGNTLKGEVLEIRKDSHYSAVGLNEFVLYVKNGSPLQSSVSDVAVGDTFEIAVNEMIEASKPITEAANTSIVAQYKLIEDSQYKPGADTLSLDHYTQRAQRTVLGIKEDGSVILFSTAGRSVTDSAPGLTIPELGAVALQMGCKTAYNLDGGGSTTMVTENEARDGFDIKLKSNETNGATGDKTPGRGVANSIFIVKKQSVDTEISTALNTLITANSSNTKAAVVAAITEANAVKANTKSMTSDYTRVYMSLKAALTGKAELDDAIAAVSAISYKNYSETTLTQIWDAYDDAVVIRGNEAATATEVDGMVTTLNNLLKNTSVGAIDQALFVTGFNQKIYGGYSIIFTPGYAATLTSDNANLNWARAIAVQWDDTLKAYKVTQVANGNGSNVITTVPANGFVLGVHGEAGDSIANKAYANNAKVGDLVVLHGIDITEKSMRPGSYITIGTGNPLKDNVSISIDDTYVVGVIENQTAAEIMGMFNSAPTIKNRNGNAITGTALVGTGSVITAGSKSYTAVINGDISGDGTIDAKDYLFAKRAFLKTLTLDAAQLKAGCLSGEALPTALDYLKIKRHFLGTYDIYKK